MITPRLISDLVFILTVHSSASLAMSSANQGAKLSSNALPLRQGTLDAEQIHTECPQFRILIISKANVGKMTILHKVCNLKLDVKPIVYDTNRKKVKVWLEKLADLAKLTKGLASL